MKYNALYKVLTKELKWPKDIAAEYIEWLKHYDNILHR